MIERVKVELIKPWSGRRVGQVFNSMDRRTADLLIKRNIAVLLEPPKKAKRKRKPKTESSE